MNLFFDNEKLYDLITNLYTLTGIQGTIFDFNAKCVCIIDRPSSFCQQINACPEGHARCRACDAEAVTMSASRGDTYFYRCHAGLCEAIAPIHANGAPIAYLAFGQLLDSSPLEEQWVRTRATLDWYPGGADSLKEAFFQLKQYSDEEFRAFSEVLKALIAYIHLSGLIQITEYTDLQRLKIYVEQHYHERISLSTVAADLNISRTRLCALAKQLSGGKNLSRMIAEHRVGAAKPLLINGDIPISAVAGAVGITDYNYFSKIFKQITGMTPSAFRNRFRGEAALATVGESKI